MERGKVGCINMVRLSWRFHLLSPSGQYFMVCGTGAWSGYGYDECVRRAGEEKNEGMEAESI